MLGAIRHVAMRPALRASASASQSQSTVTHAHVARCSFSSSSALGKIDDPEWDGRPVYSNNHVYENGWSRNTIRAGVLGIKLGMTADWDKWGRRFPLTVLQVQDCQVMDVKLAEDGYNHRMQVGCSDYTPIPKTKGCQTYSKKAQLGVFEKLNMNPKKHVREFRITEGSVLPVGTQLTAQHFIPGQYVDVRGISRDKGFQGGMKRWGWKGGAASHGNTKSHRKMGGTGGSTRPGRVFPGKNMAGHMGDDARWVRSLWVMKINTKYNLLYVKGAVPGIKGGLVKIMDAVRYRPENPVLPFPTFVPEEGVVYDEEIYAPRPDVDPYDPEIYGTVSQP